MVLMHTAPTWRQFTRSLDRAFPRPNDTLSLPSYDEGELHDAAIGS